MSFLKYLIEITSTSTPSTGSPQSAGNISAKHPVLSEVPPENDIRDNTNPENAVEEMMRQHHITIDKTIVETLIALIEKRINIWNKEKRIDPDQIKRTIVQSLNTGIIKIDK